MTVAGLHAVEEQLRRAAAAREQLSDDGAGVRGMELLYVDGGRGRGGLVSRARNLCIPVRRVSARQLDEVARREAFPGLTRTLSRHDGVLLRLSGSGRSLHKPTRERVSGESDKDARVRGGRGRQDDTVRQRLARHLEGNPGTDLLLLALDGITDPMNLGSILRSADQFGAALVMLPRRRSATMSATVHRASAGAASHVNVLEVPNLHQALAELRREEIWIYGADVEGEPVSTVRLARRAALVLGAEGSGLHRLTKEGCDQLVRVPTQGTVDSLNVGVAAGVLMYEIRRQWAAIETG